MGVIGSSLTTAQENILNNRFDQDDDLWLIFMTLYLRSKGDAVEGLKDRFMNSSPFWENEVKATKAESYNDIKQLLGEKTLQWNIRIKQFLADAGLVNILKCYLRSLVTLRSRKGTSEDSISTSHRQILAILSQVAGELSGFIDPYQEMSRCLERNQTPGGKDLTDVSRSYYQSRQNEFFNLISTYLALILIIKLTTSQTDLLACQDLIRRNLVRPLESKIDSLDKNDKKEAWAKLDNYSKLVRSFDIHI